LPTVPRLFVCPLMPLFHATPPPQIELYMAVPGICRSASFFSSLFVEEFSVVSCPPATRSIPFPLFAELLVDIRDRYHAFLLMGGFLYLHRRRVVGWCLDTLLRPFLPDFFPWFLISPKAPRFVFFYGVAQFVCFSIMLHYFSFSQRLPWH